MSKFRYGNQQQDNKDEKNLMYLRCMSEASDVFLQLDGFYLERVSSFELLELMITSGGRCQKHLTTRVAMAFDQFRTA